MENLKQSLSVSMIVKNEEDHLRTALESVKDADEIVIIDTGSTDNTIAIAKEYTRKVYSGAKYEWTDNFAYHRNQSLDRCKHDWVLIIDADEELKTSIADIKNHVKRNYDTEGFFFKTKAKGIEEYHHSIRLFRNIADIKWKGAAHNFLTGIKNTITTDFVIEYGYSNAHKKDPDRTLRILKKEVDKDPTNARYQYYLAREYWYRKKYNECVVHCDQCIQRTLWIPEKSDAYLMKARALWHQHKGDQARQSCIQAIALNPEFKEALIFMSEITYSPQSEGWRKYAANASNENVIFIR